MSVIFKIQDEISAGDLSFAEIAQTYGVTVADVQTIFEDMMDAMEAYYDDSMDGDFDSAMASAGFGTDEDYILDNDYFDDF